MPNIKSSRLVKGARRMIQYRVGHSESGLRSIDEVGFPTWPGRPYGVQYSAPMSEESNEA